MEEGDFRDWDCLLNLLYIKLEGIKKSHIFKASAVDPRYMTVVVDNIGTELPSRQKLHRKLFAATRKSDEMHDGSKRAIASDKRLSTLSTSGNFCTLI